MVNKKHFNPINNKQNNFTNYYFLNINIYIYKYYYNHLILFITSNNSYYFENSKL